MKMSETALGNQKVNSERGASIYSQIAGLAFITIQACRLHIHNVLTYFGEIRSILLVAMAYAPSLAEMISATMLQIS